HDVEAEEPSPRMIEIGPPFRDIANTTGMTATALRVFYEFTPEDAELHSHTGGDRGCGRLYREPTQSPLSTLIPGQRSLPTTGETSHLSLAREKRCLNHPIIRMPRG